MNATTNFTVKSLRANKVRTFVTIAGVALAAALLTAVLTTYVSLNDYLYRSEAHLAGTWMACVEADGSSALDEKVADAQADPQVAGTAILRDVGFAALTADQQNTQGTYLAIRSIEGDVGDICGIAPSEGRLPENDHEIMLFSTWNDYGGVNLGDTVTFNVGQRVARLAPGEEGSMSAGTMTASWGVQGEAHESEITDGTPLDSSMGVLEADIDDGIFNEEIANTEERTYTVVGFYDRPGYALSTAAGMVGVTAGGAASDAFTDVFFTLNDVANTQQVEEAAEALFPDEHVVLHTAMLRYMGVSSDSSIWTTFYGLVVVLAAVIAELFHNKFGNFVKSSLFVPVIASAIDAPLIEEPCDEDLSTRGVPCPVDRTVAHGDVVEVGNMKWKVIATPGHTPGSICLFDIPQFGNHPKGLPVLLSGDTLFAGTIGRTDFKGGSMADMRASLKKLAALPDDTAVLPGHNNLTTIGAERRRVFALYGDPE